MARKLTSTDGFIFHGWMVTELGLSGGELVAFALVHQFSQSNAGRYLGGPGYLAAWMGCSDNTARKYLHALLDRGLIINEDQEINGVLFRSYRVNYDALQFLEYPSKNLGTPLQNFGIDNNKDNNTSKEDIIINPHKPQKFDFRAALLALGVEPELAEAWMQVRKAKKAVNTEVAFNGILREINKSGHTASDCIRLAVERSWCGFKAEWMENDASRSIRPTRSTPSRNGTAVDNMLDLGRTMFSGAEIPAYDEQ